MSCFNPLTLAEQAAISNEDDQRTINVEEVVNAELKRLRNAMAHQYRQ